jgi:hypothetical protein
MDLREALDVKRGLDALFATRRGQGRPRKFALGLATPVDNLTYRVAVRAEKEGDVTDDERLLLEEETQGDLDVQVVGPIRPQSAAHPLAVTRGLAIGSSVAHRLCRAGTLGFFARKADGTIGFVSNNHVIAAGNHGNEGDPVLYPSPYDGGCDERHAAGFLDGAYPRLSEKEVRVDCAFARLAPGRSFDAGALDGGRRLAGDPVIPYKSAEVAKIGRTTGLTFGRVTAFDIDPPVYYTAAATPCPGQIEIETITDEPFSSGGDSGSLVFTLDGHPVGLIFAASVIGGMKKRGHTYANPIGAVLKALDVTLLT